MFREALEEIARDDDLVEANDAVFAIHAFRRCQQVARFALAKAQAETESVPS